MSETKQIENIKVEENNKVKKIKIDGSKLSMAIVIAFPLATVIPSIIVSARLVEAKWLMLMMYWVLILLIPIIYKVGDYIDFY